MRADSIDSFFRVEDRLEYDDDLVRSVLDGALAAVVFRKYAPTEECEELLASFLTNPSTRVRHGDATGRYLGTFHWRKTKEDYLADSDAIVDAVDAIVGRFGGASSWRKFEESLRQNLARDGVTLRRATWDGSEVASPLVRAWDGVGEYSLIPHDDLAQILDERQRGFEAQDVASYTSCAANLCFANGSDGNLVLWDYIPTREDRVAFGTELEGGPYPPSAVQGHKRIDVRIGPGDLYIFNGALVHAVGATREQRATISTLLGFSSRSTVLLWT